MAFLRFKKKKDAKDTWAKLLQSPSEGEFKSLNLISLKNSDQNHSYAKKTSEFTLLCSKEMGGCLIGKTQCWFNSGLKNDTFYRILTDTDKHN